MIEYIIAGWFAINIIAFAWVEFYYFDSGDDDEI